MEEKQKQQQQQQDVVRKISVPKINIDEIKKASPYVIMSPRSMIKQSAGGAKANCLCSPTTHAGSFRCRRHRSSLLARHGGSVGSNLSELASKSTAAAATTAMNHSFSATTTPKHSHTSQPFAAAAAAASVEEERRNS